MTLVVKAALYRDWEHKPLEIRRFSVDQDVATSYAYLQQKLVQIFPLAEADGITVAWIDADGDRIVISSDEELTDAVDQLEGSVFKIHVKTTAGSTEAPKECAWGGPWGHPRAMHRGPFGAYGCGWRGPYGHCLGYSASPASTTQHPTQVPKAPTGEEKEHHPDKDDGSDQQEDTETKKTQSPPTEKPAGPFHPGIVCDGCSGQIFGTRYKCVQCPDYDLCQGCEGKGVHTEHSMVSYEQPVCNPWARWAHGPWGFRQGGLWGMHPSFSRGGQASTHGQQPAKEGAEPMDTQEPSQPASSTEQQQQFFQNLGQLASRFLEPLGLHVSVDSVQKEEEEQSTSAKPNTSSQLPPLYEETLQKLKEMGFEDTEFWLTELVKAKEGSLERVLDSLQPVKPSE